MSSVSIYEVEKENNDVHAPLEGNLDDSTGATAEPVVTTVPAKQRKKANDSVSQPVL